MGGATSLLDHNDWVKADGKLTDVDPTLDGKAPTPAYTIVHLVKKRAMNHREYNVIDDEMNLLFTTQAVPGTICCFDVLGPGIDDYLFRITVDIARRHWVIHCYDSPSFEGQIPDQEESKKASTQLGRQVQLYKRCCVTVSWSRYMSVAAFYGPPTVEMLMAEASSSGTLGDDVIDADDDDLFQQASVIGARMQGRSYSSDSHDLVTKRSADSNCQSPVADDTSTGLGTNVNSNDEVLVEGRANHNVEDSEQISSDLPESPLSGNVHGDHAATSMPDKKAPLTMSSSAASLQSWFRQKSKDIRDKSHTYLYSTTNAKHPLEGVIHLDKPLILCQEIYTRLIGNHQTSLVSKESVLQLLKQDAAQHFKEHPEESEDVADGEEPILTVEGKIVDNTDTKKDTPPSDNVGDNTAENGNRDVAGENSVTAENNDMFNKSELNSQGEAEQPLIGYWNWEHSLRTQKMKMHLAKGTDLALHVVVAIIVNQVRYERNALAMTI